MNYFEFASNISFFEFNQNEFHPPHFDTQKYKEEIKTLIGAIDIEILTNKLHNFPRLFDIFEEIFQLQRFTNAQYIHFCFDVNALNNYNLESLLIYIDKNVFNFENSAKNVYFCDIYNDIKQSNLNLDTHLIYFVKKALINYISKLQKARKILYFHISNSISTRLRIAKYLIENLKADDFLSSINIERYLSIKRRVRDTKGIHGTFGINKIKEILIRNNIINAENLFDTKEIKLQNDKLKELQFSFVREKTVKGIQKLKDRKDKVFDFIILYKGVPKIVIETNFYSTEGTKIGINQGEYTDLIKTINEFNHKNNTNIKFLWITDGNYWLSNDGEKRYKNLKQNFFTGEFDLLNYNLFNTNIVNIIQEIKNEHK